MADPWAQFKTIGPVPVMKGPDTAEPGTDWSQFETVAPVAVERDWTQYKDWDSALADIKKLPEAEQGKAMKAWASQTVAKEREQGGVGQVVDDTIRRLARGLPIGSWADEGNAAIASMLGYDYDQQLAYERAKDTQGDEEATKLGSLPLIGDVTTAGVTKLAGGALTAPIAPGVNAFRGATLLPRMGNGALTGAAYGGLYGTGEGETLTERAGNTALGTAIGTGIGTVAPAIGTGIGNAVKYVADKWRGLPPELANIGKDATQRLARAAEDDNLVANYPRLSQELGNEGMLMDMGHNLRGQASAIANMPGEGQTIIRNADTLRAQGAPMRIRTDIDAAFGQPQNLIQAERNAVAQARANADPHFAQFHNSQVPFTRELQGIWERVPPQALRYAENIARTEGWPLMDQVQTATGEIVEIPSARAWDYVKDGIQQMLGEGGVDPASRYGSRLVALDNQLRNAVDSTFNPTNPAQSPWAQGRAASGTGKQFQQGLREGSGVFSRPKTHSPDQVADDLANASPTYEAGYRAGARGDLQAMMDDAGTQFGPTGDRAVRKGMWSENAERKVRQLASSPQTADRVLNRRNAESTFAETHNAVTANSATAARQAAQKEFPNSAESGGTGKSWTGVTIPGAMAEGIKKAANAMFSGARAERMAAMATNAARVLSATRMERDAYFRGLERYLQGQGMSTQAALQMSNAVQSILQSSIPAAVGSATSGPLRGTITRRDLEEANQ